MSAEEQLDWGLGADLNTGETMNVSYCDRDPRELQLRNNFGNL